MAEVKKKTQNDPEQQDVRKFTKVARKKKKTSYRVHA